MLRTVLQVGLSYYKVIAAHYQLRRGLLRSSLFILTCEECSTEVEYVNELMHYSNIIRVVLIHVHCALCRKNNHTEYIWT